MRHTGSSKLSTTEFNAYITEVAWPKRRPLVANLSFGTSAKALKSFWYSGCNSKNLQDKKKSYKSQAEIFFYEIYFKQLLRGNILNI